MLAAGNTGWINRPPLPVLHPPILRPGHSLLAEEDTVPVNDGATCVQVIVWPALVVAALLCDQCSNVGKTASARIDLEFEQT